MSEKEPKWPQFSWTTRLRMSIIGLGIMASRRSDGTINRRIMNLFDLKAPPASRPTQGVISSDTTVDSSRNLWFRLYTPVTTAAAASLPVIVYFHGGGFALMCADSIGCDSYCKRLARELPAIVISVNYRLTPEHRFPCQYEDGIDVLKFIDGNPFFKGFPSCANLKQCYLAGDSAGGNVAHHVTVRAADLTFSNFSIIGLIAIQPFFGGEERTPAEIRLVGAPFISVRGTDNCWKNFLPDGSDRDHPAANIFGPKAVDISGVRFPATIVIVGGFDPLQDWQRRYYEGLKKYGKEAYLLEYPNAVHTFYATPELPESGLLIEEVRGFMEKQSSELNK